MINVNLANRKKPVDSGGTGLSVNTDGLKQALEIAKELPLMRYVACIAVAVAANYGVGSYQESQVQVLQARLNSLNSEKSQLQAETSKMKGLEQTKKSMESDEFVIRTKLETIQKLMADRAAAAGVLAELAKITPGDVWFTDFELNGSNVTMDGFSLDFAKISDFMKQLNESSVFSDPALQNTQTAEDDQKREVASFQILARKR